jgi:hypothetical protein
VKRAAHIPLVAAVSCAATVLFLAVSATARPVSNDRTYFTFSGPMMTVPVRRLDASGRSS